MTPPDTHERQSLKPEDPLAECDSAKNLRSERFGDLYASTHDPIGESEHVFLDGNQLQKRWREIPEKSVHFHVGELGFGTGLNFLLTWKLWVETKDKNPGWRGLHYSGFEEFPLSAGLMEATHKNWLRQTGPDFEALQPYAKKLLNQWQCLMIGVHRLIHDKSVILDLHVDDANLALGQRAKHSPPMNAWFLDGFSPRAILNYGSPNCSHCWPSIQHQQPRSQPTPVQVTCVAISAKRVPVEKAQGWGQKRHMLVSKNKADNQVPTTPFKGPASVGKPSSWSRLAGCTVAHALAGRGWQVTIIDPAAGFERAAVASRSLHSGFAFSTPPVRPHKSICRPIFLPIAGLSDWRRKGKSTGMPLR